ncbi:thioredoxin-like protein [Aspergillus egyptiacus]|nr:thioredoxin-like protein [Aspergillus egyptiacus]
MNVLMMDSYNLAWKPAYPVNGLSNTSSDTAGPNPLLDTYHLERHANAEELINFDRKFSTSFSDKVGTAESKSGVSHEEFVNMFSPGNSFTSGVGVEYPENLIVDRALSAGSRQPVRGDDYLSGILRPGRRLLNVKLKRFADGWHRDIQDDLASTRRFRIVSLVSHDLLNAESISATAMKATSAIVHQFPPSLLEQIVIYPRWPGEVTWKNIPGCVKEQAEMSFYNGYDLEDAYQIYGADPAQGALVVIRPDGYVGLVAQLSESSRVEGHLSRIITRVD